MFCSKCGNKSPSGARFCQKCGAKTSNNSESANLLSHPASLAELGESPDSFTDPPQIGSAYDTPDTKHADSANYVNNNGFNRRAADINGKPVGSGFRRHPHMAVPTPSADMDYTFYPGQKAEPDLAETSQKNNKTDQMEYPMQPVFAKPMAVSQRAISGVSNPRLYKLPAPGASEPMQSNADIAEFTGYQILPAAYKPAEARPVYVQHEYAPANNAPQAEPEPVVDELHYVHAQHMPVQQPVAIPVPVQPAQQPVAIPAPVQPAQQPVFIPVPVQPVQQPAAIPAPVLPVPSQPVQAQPALIPLPAQLAPPPQQQAPAKVHLPSPRPILPQQMQPMHPQPQAEYDRRQEEWHDDEEYGNMNAQKPKKKSNLPTIIIAVVLFLAVGGAAFFFINMRNNVSASQIVGTWEQSPPLGTWIPRFEFNDDGTGQFYQFNTDHNVSMNEVPFTWAIESGNMMRNSLWPELAEIEIIRGARPPRFRYRLESSTSWQSFVMVVSQ